MLCAAALLLAIAVPGACEDLFDAAHEAEQAALGEDGRRKQAILSALLSGEYYDEETIFSGYDAYVEAIVEGIRQFQKEHDLPETGVADEETLEALLPGYTLRRELEAQGYFVMDCEGQAVAEIQEDLTALGYYSGSVTGHFGQKTEEAVRAYQAAKGITEDGFVDQALKEAMRAEAGGA